MNVARTGRGVLIRINSTSKYLSVNNLGNLSLDNSRDQASPFFFVSPGTDQVQTLSSNVAIVSEGGYYLTAFSFVSNCISTTQTPTILQILDSTNLTKQDAVILGKMYTLNDVEDGVYLGNTPLSLPLHGCVPIQDFVFEGAGYKCSWGKCVPDPFNGDNTLTTCGKYCSEQMKKHVFYAIGIVVVVIAVAVIVSLLFHVRNR
jgi:hypothetical protein